MKESVLKSFIKDTYKTSSPIPYIITIQILFFVVIHIFDLVDATNASDISLYANTINFLSLPSQLGTFVSQPWAIITHPFVYIGIFNILFDCLWLYWIGNMFLNLLTNRHFLTVFLGGTILGGILYVLIGQLPFFANQVLYWNTTGFGLAALISSLCLLSPDTELRLLLFGNVKFKYVALVYLGLEFAFLVYDNKIAAISYLLISILGLVFMSQLRNGKDWSKLFSNIFQKRKKLKVIKNDKSSFGNTNSRSQYDLPSQEIIDQILDKISLNGYESLTSYEKEILFKASKQKN